MLRTWLDHQFLDITRGERIAKVPTDGTSVLPQGNGVFPLETADSKAPIVRQCSSAITFMLQSVPLTWGVSVKGHGMSPPTWL